MAIAAGTKPIGLDGKPNAQLVVPQLFEDLPVLVRRDRVRGDRDRRAGPAAIMSIAAANLFTRNIYRDFFRPGATPAQEAKVSKLASLVVKFGALIFVLDPRQARSP